MTSPHKNLPQNPRPATGGPVGRCLSPLEQLAREPFRFDFFQAVRLLELAAQSQPRGEGTLRPHPVGEDFEPARESVRFKAAASQSFPASAITAFTPAKPGTHRGENDRPAEMTVAFMGLTGPSGVLPQHYTQRLIDELREDPGMKEFFDLFNHRVISHFFRAWKKYHFAISYEAEARKKQPGDQRKTGDLFTYGLYCLIGMGTGGLRRRQEIPDEGLLYFAGQFAHQPRTAISLERMVADYFELPTEIVQFVGQWLRLRAADQTRLSLDGSASGNSQLGITAIAGDRVWGIENKFRVRLGPLSYARFCELTPAGSELTPLAQFVRTYAGPDLDFDVQLILRRNEVPPCQLATGGRHVPHVGWNTWILSSPLKHDADDAVFKVEGLPIR